MQLRPGLSRLPLLLGILAIATAILAGLSLRLDDPLQSQALPAEDPYTHKAFIREHLRDGELNPLYDGGSVYPPGMHAFIAAVWVYTGFDLLPLMRLGPALLGAIGILGMALLLWRHTSPTGAVVGAWAYAVAPEVIFRTTMMAPTALDLAILPFLLYAFLELARGKWGWGLIAALVTAFFVFAHPWLLLVLGAMGALLLILAFLMPWPEQTADRWTPLGVAGLIAIFAVGASVAILRGATGTLDMPHRIPVADYGSFIMVAAFMPLVFVLLYPRLARRVFPWWGNWRGALWVAIGVNLVLVAVVVRWTLQANAIGFPEEVRLQGMVGWPILAMAAAAFVALPFLRGPVALTGAALCLATYPFVVFNVFDSEFWPHRTAVFLAVGLVIMTGVAAWGAERAVRALAGHAVRWIALRRARDVRPPSPEGHDVRMPAPMHPQHLQARKASIEISSLRRPDLRMGRASSTSTGWVLFLPLLFVALPLAGAVGVVTPEPYEGWYRLFDDCDHDVLERVARIANLDPTAIVVSGSWQAKLVIAGFTDDATRVWYTEPFFLDERSRNGLLEWPRNDPFPLYAVVDRYMIEDMGIENLGFLKTTEWEPVTWGCGGSDSGGVITFRFQGTPDT